MDENGVAAAGTQCTYVISTVPAGGENAVLTFVVRVLSFNVPPDIQANILNCVRISPLGNGQPDSRRELCDVPPGIPAHRIG